MKNKKTGITSGKKIPIELFFARPIVYSAYDIYLDPNDFIQYIIPAYPLEEDLSDFDFSYPDPAQDPNLFYAFAKIKTDTDILSFVSKNGLIGTNSKKENYEFFRKEQKKAKQLLDLYLAVIINNKLDSMQAIKKHLNICKDPSFDSSHKWKPKNNKYIVELDGERVQLDEWYIFSEFDFLSPSHWQLVALDIISRFVDKKLSEIRLHYRSIDTLKLIKDPNKMNYNEIFSINPVLRCPTLLSLMYLQFYFTLASSQKPKPCKKCETFFKPETHREQYCYDCRFDKYGITKYPSQSTWNKKHKKTKEGDE